MLSLFSCRAGPGGSAIGGELRSVSTQADTIHWSLADGTGVEILDFVDAYSRLVTVAVVLPVTTAADVVAAFYQGAGRFGLPATRISRDKGDRHSDGPCPQLPGTHRGTAPVTQAVR
jgi:hypothetical protein